MKFFVVYHVWMFHHWLYNHAGQWWNWTLDWAVYLIYKLRIEYPRLLYPTKRMDGGYYTFKEMKYIFKMMREKPECFGAEKAA